MGYMTKQEYLAAIQAELARREANTYAKASEELVSAVKRQAKRDEYQREQVKLHNQLVRLRARLAGVA